MLTILLYIIRKRLNYFLDVKKGSYHFIILKFMSDKTQDNLAYK